MSPVSPVSPVSLSRSPAFQRVIYRGCSPQKVILSARVLAERNRTNRTNRSFESRGYRCSRGFENGLGLLALFKVEGVEPPMSEPPVKSTRESCVLRPINAVPPEAKSGWILGP